jgi:hypothetical protein
MAKRIAAYPQPQTVARNETSAQPTEMDDPPESAQIQASKESDGLKVFLRVHRNLVVTGAEASVRA